MTANLYDPAWDQDTDRPPFRWRRAMLGRQVGAEKLGASLFEIPPGGVTFPYHAHHANEELLLVLAGEVDLRTPDGERTLATGEVVSFAAGLAGAHRLENRSDAPARVLVVSTMLSPEINEFPDTGVRWARSFAPGAAAPEGAAIVVGKTGDRLDPLDGAVGR